MQQLTWQKSAVRDVLRHIKLAKPFCYGMTNYIAANLSANVLLAVGAAPAIGGAMDWPTVFGANANAVWINSACLMSDSPHQVSQTAQAAHAAGVPWVLDPVALGAGASEYDQVVLGLLAFKPTAIRGNASELIALTGGQGGGKGVETTLTSQDALPYIEEFARRQGCIMAVSGPVDYITDGTRTVSVAGGDARLTQVTGAGCSLGALIAAALSSPTDPLTAVAAAHAFYAEASQRASGAQGTGSFAVAFLDTLSLLDSESV